MSLTYAASITVARSADELYDMVSDVTRTGQWSPICKACWWDEGDSAQVGAWFTGRNQSPERTWETRSLVVAADPGREFAWVVGGSWARWGYSFTSVEADANSSAHGERRELTEVTESWHFLPAGVALFDERYGADAAAEVAARAKAAREGIPVTLAAIKRIAEAG